MSPISELPGRLLDDIPLTAYSFVMKLHTLKAILSQYPDARPRFMLPDGDYIPAHYHVTEVGHVTKRFIDCGGQLHDRKDTCLLQTYVARDIDHRLNAGRFLKILELGKQILPHEDMDVEVEYDCCVVAQYPIADAKPEGDHIEIRLGERHTDCLAKQTCGTEGQSCGTPADATVSAVPSCC
jgi:hypothetical protein